jgi:hypothetical protein
VRRLLARLFQAFMRKPAVDVPLRAGVQSKKAI